MKTLITFVHFDRPNDSLYRENLNFFLKAGLVDSSDQHFNFVVNSKKGGENIPQQKNVSVIKGHNKGYDFGAYKESLESICTKDFDYFIFINDTCRGPFIPIYIPKNLTWVDLFLSQLDEEIKIVGPTCHTNIANPWIQENLSVPPDKTAHIQSYCWGIDTVSLNILLEDNLFDTLGKSRSEVVKDHEIEISQKILSQGFKTKSFQLSNLSPFRHNSDINYPNAYFGCDINPLEIMFIKTNRIMNKIVKNYSEWRKD